MGEYTKGEGEETEVDNVVLEEMIYIVLEATRSDRLLH